MVEEAERPLLREGDEPERELGHLDGHRVTIDAVDAAIRDGAASGDEDFVRVTLRLSHAREDPRFDEPLCEVATSRNEDGA